MIVIEEEPAVADEKKNLKVYEVEQANGVVATLKLSDADAELMGVKKPAAAAAGKARTAPNKAAAQPNPAASTPNPGDGTATP